MAQDYGVGGSDLLALRQRLDDLTAEQTLLLDKVLEDMDNPNLNAQLKALAKAECSVANGSAPGKSRAAGPPGVQTAGTGGVAGSSAYGVH